MLTRFSHQQIPHRLGGSGGSFFPSEAAGDSLKGPDQEPRRRWESRAPLQAQRESRFLFYLEILVIDSKTHLLAPPSLR